MTTSAAALFLEVNAVYTSLPIEKEIADIRDQIIRLFHPVQIYLFGSWAKGRARKNSDIDLCLIAETDDKRELVRQILLGVEYERDLEVVVYTPGEWEKYLKGFLLKHTAINQEGHNLLKLCKKAALYDRNLETFTKDCAFLNTYYVETRYPQEDPLEVTEKDVQECIRIVNAIIGHIWGR